MPLIVIPLVSALVIFFAYIEVRWASWVLHEMFHKHYTNWQIFAALFVIALFTPKQMQGIIAFVLLLCTLYIHFLR